jgi:hypothetical protein
MASAGYAQKITPFDPLGSTATTAAASNSDCEIAGYYIDPAGIALGFLRHESGRITSFDEGPLGGTLGNHGFLRQTDGSFA